MPVKLIEIKGKYCPFFVCDYCKQPITPERGGMAIYQMFKRGEPEPYKNPDAWFVHYGNCIREAEAFHRENGIFMGSTNLTEFEEQLSNNLKIPFGERDGDEEWLGESADSYIP